MNLERLAGDGGNHHGVPALTWAKVRLPEAAMRIPAVVVPTPAPGTELPLVMYGAPVASIVTGVDLLPSLRTPVDPPFGSYIPKAPWIGLPDTYSKVGRV